MKYTDIDIENISKIELIEMAIKTEISYRGLDSIYLITLILNKYFDVGTSNLKVLYKLMLKEAIDKETTLSDVFINILYEYCKNMNLYLDDKKYLDSLNNVCKYERIIIK